MKKKIAFLILAISIVLQSCSSSLQISKFLPDSNDLHKSEKTIKIKNAFSAGTKDIFWTGKNEITMVEFYTYLKDALSNTQIFSPYIEGKVTQRYSLSAAIVSQDYSGLFTITGKAQIKYELYDEYFDQKVFEKSIYSEYEASVGDAFVGNTRMRLALQGAVFENIRQMILELSKLNL